MSAIFDTILGKLRKKDESSGGAGVSTVNGRSGAVVLTDADVGLSAGRYINDSFTGSVITLADTPKTNTELLFIDGTLQTETLHYTRVDNVITLTFNITTPVIINCPYHF